MDIKYAYVFIRYFKHKDKPSVHLCVSPLFMLFSFLPWVALPFSFKVLQRFKKKWAHLLQKPKYVSFMFVNYIFLYTY